MATQLLLDATNGDGKVPQPMSTTGREAIARVCSNILEEGQLDRPRTHTSNTEGHYVATVEAVTSILAAMSRSAAADLVSNQDAVTIETPAFSMQVARIDTNSRSNVKTGVRAVEELPAELPSDVELQTITWQKNPFAPFAPLPLLPLCRFAPFASYSIRA